MKSETRTIALVVEGNKVREREKKKEAFFVIQRGGSPIGNSRSSDFPNQHSKLGAAGATSSSHSHSSSNSDKPRSKRDETTIRELEVRLGYIRQA